MLNWLHTAGFTTVLVHAADQNGVVEKPWGVELAIRDPLRRHPDPSGHFHDGSHHVLKTNQLIPGVFKTAGKLLLIPDLDVLWSLRVASHPTVLAQARGADCVISSSPPESVHLGAARLARKTGAKFIMDMRDGWLDEPLKQYLHGRSLRRVSEVVLERKTMRHAERILVTSEEWEVLLNRRLTFTQGKTVVLTNSSVCVDAAPVRTNFAGQPVRLVYAGQFTHSKPENRAGLLLECLWQVRAAMPLPTIIEFYGVYNDRDVADITRWERPFASCGHRLSICAPLGFADLRRTLREAHGTLLLSATQAAIVGKFFDCLASGRPVLTVTHRGSATWNAAKKSIRTIPMDLDGGEENAENLRRYYELCSTTGIAEGFPDEFSDPYAKRIFLAAIAAAQEV